MDALCRRFGVDNSSREKHGALLDSEILAEVYLELIGGRQPDFSLNVVGGSDADKNQSAWVSHQRPTPLASLRTADETAAHDEFVEALGAGAVWKIEK